MLAARRTFAALAALSAAAYAQDKCSSASSGTKTDNAIQLKEVTMPPGVADFGVDPQDVCPSPLSIVGSSVKACDGDVEPAVYNYKPAHAEVRRKGSTATEGKIYTTIYCGAPNVRSGYVPQHQPYQTGVMDSPVWPQESGVQGAPNVYNAPNAYNAYSGGSYAYDPYAHQALEAHAHGASHEHVLGSHYAYAPKLYGGVDSYSVGSYAAVLPIVFPLHHK